MINLKTTEKIILKIAIIFSVLVLISILLLNKNTFYWADDYNFLIVLDQIGIIKNCIDGYFNWDGRYMSIGGFVQGFAIKYLKVEFITLFWNLCFLTSGFLTFQIIVEELNLKPKKSIKLFLGLVMAIIIWYGSSEHIAQTIYWGTGGVYSFSLLLGFIWILIYQRKIKIENDFKTKFFLLIFSFFAGASTQNLSIGLITLVLINLIIQIITNKHKNLKLNLLILLMLTTGILVLILAPGNTKRMLEIPGINLSTITFSEITDNFYTVLTYYYKSNKTLILMSLLSGLAFRTFLYDNSIKLSLPRNKINIALFLNNFKWLFIALSTITPFIIMPMMATERTMIYFAFFLAVFIFHIILKNYTQSNFKFKFQNIISYLLIVIVLTITFVFSVDNMKKGLVVKNEMIKREESLKNSVSKTVIVKIIPKRLKSSCYNFFDLTMNCDDQHFMVVGLKDYYKINKIIITE